MSVLTVIQETHVIETAAIVSYLDDSHRSFFLDARFYITLKKETGEG